MIPALIMLSLAGVVILVMLMVAKSSRDEDIWSAGADDDVDDPKKPGGCGGTSGCGGTAGCGAGCGGCGGCGG